MKDCWICRIGHTAVITIVVVSVVGAGYFFANWHDRPKPPTNLHIVEPTVGSKAVV